MAQMIDREMLEAFLWDRFAEAIRQPPPRYSDESFDIAEYYVAKVMEILKDFIPKSDKFCGIPMDSDDVEAKLNEYGYIPRERAKDLKDKLDEAIEHLSVFLDDEPCQFDHHGYCQAHGFLGPEPGCGTADAIKFVKAIANSPDVIKGEEDE